MSGQQALETLEEESERQRGQEQWPWEKGRLLGSRSSRVQVRSASVVESEPGEGAGMPSRLPTTCPLPSPGD